jgi:PAS domain S-box-containing protein
MGADWSGIGQCGGDAVIAETQSPSEAWLSHYVYADDRPTVGKAIQEAIRTKGVFDLEHRSGRNDGTFGWTHSRAIPVLDEHGEISEWFGTATDVSARRQTEEALTDSEQRLSLALQVGGVIGTWDWDIRNDALRADSRLAALFGVDREMAERGLPLKAFLTAIHPKDRDRVTASIQQASTSGGDYAEEHRIVQPDGAEQWVLARGRCLLNETGTPYRFLGVAIDINERKRAEDHQKMLMAELDHRVKNLLAVIQSVAHRSLRGGDGEATGRFTGRLAALAHAHTMLADSHWEGASLKRLATQAMAAYGDGYPEGRVTLSGPDLLLTPRAAQTLTLCIHELATNAAKYGALSIPAGRVTVDWNVNSNGDRLLILVWREMGGPLIEAPPKVKGFGSMLIERSLTYELEGEVDLVYRPTGLVVTLKLPLAALVKTVLIGERPLQQVRDAPVRQQRFAGKRILVVEDQHLIAEQVEEVLLGAGCNVVGPVPTITRASRLVVEEELDAAVLDINLNGEMIWPVAEALQSRGTPFLFLTGYAEAVELPAGLGKVLRIGKPFEPEQLVCSLAAILEQQSSGAAAD